MRDSARFWGIGLAFDLEYMTLKTVVYVLFSALILNTQGASALSTCSYIFALDKKAFQPLKNEIEAIILENYTFKSQDKATIDVENFRKRVLDLEKKARKISTLKLLKMIDASLAVEHGTKGYLAGLDTSLSDVRTIQQLVEDSGKRFTFEEYWNALPESIRESLGKEDYAGVDTATRTTHWKNFLGNILFTTTILILKEPESEAYLDTHVDKTEYNHIAIFILHKILIERIIQNPGSATKELDARIHDRELFLKNVKALESFFEY